MQLRTSIKKLDMTLVSARTASSDRGPKLTEEHRWQYHNRGFTVVRNIISDERAISLGAVALDLSKIQSACGRVHRDPDDRGEFRIDVDIHRRSGQFMELAFSTEMLRTAAHFIESKDFYFFYDQLFIKLARTETRTQWHQDLPFWPLAGSEIPSIWIALSTTDEERSAVQYIAGSHMWPTRFAAVNAEDRRDAMDAGLLVCPDFHTLPSYEHQMFSHKLNPGDAIVHHPLVVHGSGPNIGDTPRIAVSFRYMSSRILWEPRHDAMFFPLAGDLPAGTKMCDQSVFRLCTL